VDGIFDAENHHLGGIKPCSQVLRDPHAKRQRMQILDWQKLSAAFPFVKIRSREMPKEKCVENYKEIQCALQLAFPL
jgi:hypothetical protein